VYFLLSVAALVSPHCCIYFLLPAVYRAITDCNECIFSHTKQLCTSDTSGRRMSSSASASSRTSNS